MNTEDKTKEHHKKHNAKRTKTAQKDNLSKGTKRRVNITIDGNVWDDMENLDYESKSKFIEELIQKQLKEHRKKS